MISLKENRSDHSQNSSVLGGYISRLYPTDGPCRVTRRIEIIANRFTCDPDVNTLKRGHPVVLVLRSIDVTHGLKIDEMNVRSEDIKKGKETEIQFTPGETGHYVGRCAFLRETSWIDDIANRRSSMRLTLTILRNVGKAGVQKQREC